MKKITASFLCGIMLASGLVFALSSQAIQLIADRNFQDGVSILAPVGGAVEGTIQYKEPYGTPWWTLGQWGSQETIYGADSTRLISGSTQWSNSFKSMVLGPLDSDDQNLILAVDAVAEYGGVYRQAGEPWPAMLIAQRISEPTGWFKEYAPNINDLHELILDIELRLLYANHVYDAGYNSGMHAAQFLLYFTVQNLNKTSADYGDFLWFGLRFYDDREPLPGLSVNHDIGTSKLIYNVGISPFCTNGMQVGEWKRVTGDLLPHMKAGLQEAWSRGYLTNSFDFADYKIGGMNMGWEVPGLSDVSMQVRDFGLQAYGLNFAKPYEFNMDGESDGWSFVNMTDLAPTGALNGVWVLSVPDGDPQLIGPEMRLSADRYQQVVVRMANAGNPVDGSKAQLFWRRAGDAGFAEARSAKVTVGNGGGWEKYSFDLSSNTNWNGEIVQLRLDPIMYGDGHSIGVDYIRPVAGEVAPEDVSLLSLDVSGGLDRFVLFWGGVPYQQYTLQSSTNLSVSLWTDVTDGVDVPFSGSLMQHSLSNTNSDGQEYYRLQVSPGT